MTLQVVIVGVGLRKEGDRDDIYAKVRRALRGLKKAMAVVRKTPTRINIRSAHYKYQAPTLMTIKMRWVHVGSSSMEPEGLSV